MSISFASCGGDDNNPDNPIEKNVEASKSAIVGNWENVANYGNVVMGYSFKADGTGIGFEAYKSPAELHETWPINWSYKNSVLKIDEGCEGDEADITTYDVRFLGESSMSWTEYDDNGKLTTKTTTYRKVSKFFWE